MTADFISAVRAAVLEHRPRHGLVLVTPRMLQRRRIWAILARTRAARRELDARLT